MRVSGVPNLSAGSRAARRSISSGISRITFLALSCLAFVGCSGPRPENHAETKVLVLGIDGMDPKILTRLMDAGKMPNFKALAQKGCFSPLATSMPPQSPVAWANFISGSHPGTHQIYDFIHRQPDDPKWPGGVRPFESVSEVRPAEENWLNNLLGYYWDWTLAGKQWRIPLASGRIKLFREGEPFWDFLTGAGVHTTIYRMPANYPPPSKSHGSGGLQCLCGMGTVDVAGSPGMFTYLGPEPTPSDDRQPAGGTLLQLLVDENGHGEVAIPGPKNFLQRPHKIPGKADEDVDKITLPIEVDRDLENPVARFRIGDQTVVLSQGEWSDWIPVRFETGFPMSSVANVAGLPTSAPAIIRLFVQEVHPDLRVYISPPNIDPLAQFQPISYPMSFAENIADANGRFYTTGIPEDTKALRANILNEDEFLQMAHALIKERKNQYRDALANFKEGFLFYYFGHIDQLCHIFWRDQDPDHPGRLAEQGDTYAGVIEEMYVDMDGLLGEAMKVIDDNDVLIALSDHGFSGFRRGLNLNTWLAENGYLKLKSPSRMSRNSSVYNIDFSQTRAYALGINSLYINLKGREREGIVAPSERAALMKEISEKLLAFRDSNGEPVVVKMYDTLKDYPGANPKIAPDLLVGYAANYRASWATTLGSQPDRLVEDNRDRWSGDHCIADFVVPGVLLSDHKLTVNDPTLSDLAPSILNLFGVTKPKEMGGRVVLSK